MTQALIDPTTSVQYISSWKLVQDKYVPVYTTIPNSARVAEVATNTFPVASPLFWVTCSALVVADRYYYDQLTLIIQKIPDAPPYPKSNS